MWEAFFWVEDVWKGWDRNEIGVRRCLCIMVVKLIRICNNTTLSGNSLPKRMVVDDACLLPNNSSVLISTHAQHSTPALGISSLSPANIDRSSRINLASWEPVGRSGV